VIVALWIAVIALWVLFFGVALAMLALYRHFGQMYMTTPQQKIAQGPALGSALPSLALVDVGGRAIQLPASKPTAIYFTSTTCTFCIEVREALADPPPVTAGVDLIVLCAGPRADVEAWASRCDEKVHVVWDRKEALIDRFDVNGTPYAIAVGVEGRVHAKSIIGGADGVAWAAEQAKSLAVLPADVTDRKDERILQ